MMNMINAESKQNLTIAFESYSRNLIENVVSHLSNKYNFDMEEALSSLYSKEDRNDRDDLVPNSDSDSETVTEGEREEQVEEPVEEPVEPVKPVEVKEPVKPVKPVKPVEVKEPEPADELTDESNIKPNEIPFIKTSYTVPYYGQVYNTCYGIKTNHDLFTQCSNPKIKNASHNYCKTCFKQSQANGHGFPNAGNIMQRIQCKSHEYRDPRRKLTKPYGAFLKKMKLSRQDVEKEFKEHGIEIPEEFWVESWPKKQPSKKQPSTKQPSKKPFTPKVTVSDSEEEKEPEPEPEPVAEEEKTEVLKLQTIEVEGQKFLLSEDNIVYDIDTEDEIGVFEDGNIELN